MISTSRIRVASSLRWPRQCSALSSRSFCFQSSQENKKFKKLSKNCFKLEYSSPLQCPVRPCTTTSTAKNLAISRLRPELKSHDDLYKFSINQPEVFWAAEARDTITWMQDFDTVMDCDFKFGKFEWFKNGKLNASVNCIDRHLAFDADKVALLWEKDEPGQQEYITYKQLSDMVNKLANLLKSYGIKKGDIVAIYMPVCPMTVATMLACARIGAIHSVIFAGFSSQAIASRVQDMSAVAIVTANEGFRGGKKIPLRKTVAGALANNQCPTVKNIFVYERNH